MIRILMVPAMFLAMAAAHAHSIALPEKPTPTEESAAQLIREVLNKSVEGELRVNNKAAQIHIVRDEKALPPETWRIQTSDNRILIAGNGGAGTLYAAAIFLERAVSWRCWNTLEEYFPPRRKNPEVPPINASGRPAFSFRDIYPETGMRRDGGRFAAINRLNRCGYHPMLARYGGGITVGSPFMVHTFFRYFPEKTYLKNHPEYFSLIAGRRRGGNLTGQLCLTNEEVVQAWIEKLKKFIEQDEAAAARNGTLPPRIYDVSPNDNKLICQCASCAEVIRKEGADSAPVLNFVNRIAREAARFRPDVTISTLAYLNTETPPATVKPEANVMIRLCNTQRIQCGELPRGVQDLFDRKLEAWSGRAGLLSIWEYGILTCRPQLPYPSEFYFPAQFRKYGNNPRIRGIFVEHQTPDSADMYAMKLYLEVKLLENPMQDAEALRKDFLNRYYGAAADGVDQYRGLLLESVRRNRSLVMGYYPTPSDLTYLDLDTVLASLKVLDRAKDLVAHDPVLSERVDRVRVNLDRAVYGRQVELQHQWLMRGKRAADFPLDRNAAIDRVRTVWGREINRWYDSEAQKKKLRAEMEKELEFYASLPKVTLEPDAPGGIVIPVWFAKLFRRDHQADSASTFGRTVKVEMNGENARRHAMPMSFGGYDVLNGKEIFKGSFPASRIKGSGYHWYKLAEFDPVPGGYCYVLNDWTVQFQQNAVAGSGKRHEFWLRMCFTGKRSAPDSVAIDACAFVPVK